MKKALVCIVPDMEEAESIVSRLHGVGFSSNDISVLFPNTEGTNDFAHTYSTKAPEGAVAGIGAGGAVGGTIGLLAGLGSLVIPGLGPFIAAGPLIAALSGAAAGMTLGGIGGALVGLGIPEIEAKRYEGKIRGGNILISVHTEDREAQKRAEQIFNSANAPDARVTREASVPSSRM